MPITDVNKAIRIAVADDNAAALSTLANLLKALGYTVAITATNGEELIDACANEEVDLVFADLDMPIMDGLAAAEIIAAKGIPVILISGHPDVDYVVVENEPLVSSIRKPATIDTLEAAINKALQKSSNAT